MSPPTSARPNPPKRLNKMASKDINLNDLLNFSLPPRQNASFNSVPRRSRKTGNGQGVWNKERFVNAQYRFIMNPSGEYTVHFADPDIYFQWQDILQVIVPCVSRVAGDTTSSDVESLSTCPICLSPPVAPRMTKCGHVFCFPCILRYLSASENKWARCPICFDPVHERQLKSVKWFEGTSTAGPSTATSESSSMGEGLSTYWDPILEMAPRAGSSLRMRLMQRPQITTLALPRSQTWPSDLLPPHQAPFHFLPDVFNFSKFMLATPECLLDELSNELGQLVQEKQVMSNMQDERSVYFLNGAMEKVKHQMEKAAALETPILNEQVEKAQRTLKEIQHKAQEQLRRSRVEQPSASSVTVEDVPQELLRLKSMPTPSALPNVSAGTPFYPGNSQNRQNPSRQRRNVNPPPPSTSTYYYYQAASGLPIFLHPLDIKILLSHFHNYSSFPDEITVQVEARSEGTVNDDLRKRFKYLAHLPESADVIVVESDLEGVVGADGLKGFEGALKTRSSRRKQKTRRDDKSKARAEERDREQEQEALSRFMPSNRSVLSSIPVSEGFGSPPHTDGSASESQTNAPSSPPPIPTGAWGSRSFASALHSTGAARAQRREVVEEDWDAEAVWQDLEQKTLNNDGGGGKKKRAARMVVLGSSGPMRR